jgi:putative acetyltransferase
MTAEIQIREERSGDLAAIRELNEEAFGQALEARIIDELRANGAILLSLVAAEGRKIIGNIVYSPASIGGKINGAALGPMAVHPAYQRKGIGARLVESGNARIKDAGWPFVIVLGHPEYYPRFGFRPASFYGIRCEWDVPDDAFMALILDEKRMQGVAGIAQYRKEFSIVS